MDFQKEHIPVLDAILKILIDSEMPIDLEYLQQINLLDNSQESVKLFNYYACVLKHYGCCKINKQIPDYWIIYSDENVNIVFENGGFGAIYDSLEKNRKYEEQKIVKEEEKLDLEIRKLKRDGRENRIISFIAISVAVASLIVSIVK